MKTRSLYLAALMLGFISWSCTKSDNLNAPGANQGTLKTSINNGVTELTSAMNNITSSAGYQVLSGPSDLTTKSLVLSPLDTVTHSILLSDIAGVYDYKAKTITKGHRSFLSFFTKTAANPLMIVKLPEQKVVNSRTLLRYTASDTLLANDYVITLSDYQYRFKYFNGYTYQLASSINVKNVDAGLLKVTTSNNQTSGYHFASEFDFPSGYVTKMQYSSGDTATSVYSILKGAKTLYEEKYTAIRTSASSWHREKSFSLTIGNVLIQRSLIPGQSTLDSAKVYVGGVLQLHSKVEIVDTTVTDPVDNSITSQRRELKITFDDGTSQTFTQLAGTVIDNIYALFTSMRQVTFATGIVDWIAWDVYNGKL